MFTHVKSGCICFLWLLQQITTKLLASKNTNVLSFNPLSQKSYWAKIKILTGLWLFWMLQGESVSLPCWASRGCLHSLTRDHFLCLWSWQHSIFKALSLTLTLLPPSYKGPCGYAWPTCIIQDNLLNILNLGTTAKPLCHVRNRFEGSEDYNMNIFGELLLSIIVIYFKNR